MAARARDVLLAGCGLPRAWSGATQWRVLETGFGHGLNFLATWRAWKADPQRPRMLHFASVQALPVTADDLLRAFESDPDLEPLARELAAQWWGLVPGLHRLSFEGGRVLLTLCIGQLRERLQDLDFDADAVFLDGFGPQVDAGMWEQPTLRAVARLCRRGTRLATWTTAEPARRSLAELGFVTDTVPELPPGRECLRVRFDPAWDLRRPPRTAREPASALVVGAGLAGAAMAASLARRGWRVQVLDRAMTPAAGASGLPAGLLAPHTSPDDNLLSRLSRAGVRMTLQAAREQLRAGIDWQQSGVLEQRSPDDREPVDLGPWGDEWQRWQDIERRQLWHAAGAWIRPASLVRTWLEQDGIAFVGGADVQAVSQTQDGWQARDGDGRVLAEAPVAVLAAALGSAPLADGLLALQPVRGQVSWGIAQPELLAPAPLNGNGHFLPAVPLEEGMAWLTGSTYVRGDVGLEERPLEHAANLQRLQQLSPAIGARLAGDFEAGRVRGWTGVRCASADRRPLAGELRPDLLCSVAMGSRGLTFALLCAELLAARLHAEPGPLPVRLAGALEPKRQRKAVRN